MHRLDADAVLVHGGAQGFGSSEPALTDLAGAPSRRRIGMRVTKIKLRSRGDARVILCGGPRNAMWGSRG